jgi:hypothetical protein
MAQTAFMLGLAIGVALSGIALAVDVAPPPDPDAAFTLALRDVGQCSGEAFVAHHRPVTPHLERLTWDATSAKYYDEFTADPQAPEQQRHHGRADFRLDDAERRCFATNGFVVSERLGAASMVEIFDRLHGRDLPVFVSADSILHAWHRSFDAVLAELEQACLSPALDDVLAGMAAAIPDAQGAYASGVLGECLDDADWYLAVGRSLLAGHAVPGHRGHDDRVAITLEAIGGERTARIEVFGRERIVDCSLFKPRGHYTRSEDMRRYFRALIL